jgi:hypothetical protein
MGSFGSVRGCFLGHHMCFYCVSTSSFALLPSAFFLRVCGFVLHFVMPGLVFFWLVGGLRGFVCFHCGFVFFCGSFFKGKNGAHSYYCNWILFACWLVLLELLGVAFALLAWLSFAAFVMVSIGLFFRAKECGGCAEGRAECGDVGMCAGRRRGGCAEDRGFP